MTENLVVPGGQLTTHDAGLGTFIKDNFIYSSLVGYVSEVNNTSSQKPIFTVTRTNNTNYVDLVPAVNDTIIGKVHSISARAVQVDIMCDNDLPLKSAYSGILRKENIRDFEIDKIEIYECYRPGDIIKAEILSLGDSKSYNLTTAKNNLGVINAFTEDGYELQPLSYNEMICPVTKVKVPRKVAFRDQVSEVE